MDKTEKLLECVTVQSQVLPPLIFLSYCTFTVLPTLSAIYEAHTHAQTLNASTAKPIPVDMPDPIQKHFGYSQLLAIMASVQPE